MPTIAKPSTLAEEHRYMTAEHFDAIYAACDTARMPRKAAHKGRQYEAPEWWRALLATIWATGMRISAALSLRWEDADLDAGVLKSLARFNKRKKDIRHVVGPDVVRHLEAIRQLADPRVFPWNHARRNLDVQWDRIQQEAGIHLPCSREHVHTASCHLYGFHCIRYAHATYDYGRVEDERLQEQMGHASAVMTKHYIQFAKDQAPKPYDAFLPAKLVAAVDSGLQQAASG